MDIFRKPRYTVYKHVDVNLIVAALGQYIILKSILGSILHMIPQGFINDLPDHVCSAKLHPLFKKQLKTYHAKAYMSGLVLVFLCGTDHQLFLAL